MKKKLLLIPITLLTTLLGACNPFKVLEPREASPIYIEQWLDNAKAPNENPNCGEFWILENNVQQNHHDDYELKVRDIIKKGVKNKNGNKVDSKAIARENLDFIGYKVYSAFGDLTACFIYVYEDGTITTQAYGGGWGAPKPQFYVYDVGKTITDEIISKTKERYYEINDTLNNIYETVREEATVDKFFANVEESTTPALIQYRETRKDERQNEFNYHDDDKSILNSLKELEYVPKEKGYSVDILPMITYGVTDEWTLQIFCGWDKANYDVAAIDYIYKGSYSSYYPSHFRFYYSIDATKASAIADTIRNNH